LAQSVGIGRAFNFDDLGAQIAVEAAQFAAGDDNAEVDDAQPLKGAVQLSRRREGYRVCQPTGFVLPGGRRGVAESAVLAVDGEITGRDAHALAWDEFGVGN